MIEHIKNILTSIQADVNYAYPYDNMDEEKAHTALVRIEGRVQTLNKFLTDLKASQPE